MRTLTKIIGGFTDSQFVCQWDGRNADENLTANKEIETACFQCGVSPITFHVKMEIGKAIVTGWELEVNCVYNDLKRMVGRRRESRRRLVSKSRTGHD